MPKNKTCQCCKTNPVRSGFSSSKNAKYCKNCGREIWRVSNNVYGRVYRKFVLKTKTR